MGLILRLMEPFLQYLDNYKTVDADFMDINNLIYVINQDYYKNKYFLPFYVGDSKIFKMCIQPSSSNLEQKQMFPPLNSMNHPSFIKKKSRNNERNSYHFRFIIYYRELPIQ